MNLDRLKRPHWDLTGTMLSRDNYPKKKPYFRLVNDTICPDMSRCFVSPFPVIRKV